ncbi:MAG: hypothetical protein H6667_07920 [Ardenticatenaceae bacterium]|nr:hypothetical protein [Ardenticatenaceae bacterium]
MNQTIKNTLKTVYIVLLHLVAGFAIGMAAQDKMLIAAAIPFAVVLILAVRFLGAKPELLAWAGLTVWLGSTYLSNGEFAEYMLFFVYVTLAALGIFKSPYFIVIAWLFHPVWDFVPRELPDLLKDLPVACIIFDLPIGFYILWFTRSKRWESFGSVAPDRAWYSLKDKLALIRVGKTVYVVFLVILVSFAAVASIESGILIWVALPCSILLIVGLRLLGNQAELIAWAAFTGWLGMTYAHTGGAVDIAVFVIYIAIAALGVFSSPYYLAIAWLVFIPWNLMPHELPAMYSQLPLASAIFDIPIALYLLWVSRQNRWNIEDMNKSEYVDAAISA